MTAGNDTRPGAPERIWIKADVDRSEGGDFAWFTPFVPSQPSIEYVRADALSPAASEGEGVAELRTLLDVADDALDKDTYDEMRKFGDIDPQDDDEICITVGTRSKLNKLIGALDRALSAAPKPPQSPSLALAEVPAREWRCFHCDEVFTDQEAAAVHFGDALYETPACQLTRDQSGVVGLLRDANNDLARYRAEDTNLIREVYALGTNHNKIAREEEEKGYARGLADGRVDCHPAALAEENRVLREALKPFADLADIFHANAKGEWPITDAINEGQLSHLTINDLRAARAALSTAHPSAQAYREAFGEMLAALKKIQAYIDDAPSPFESAEANQCVNEVIAKAEALK